MFGYIDLLFDLYNYFRIKRSAQNWVKSAEQSSSLNSYGFPIQDNSFYMLEEQNIDDWDVSENDLESDMDPSVMELYFKYGPGSWRSNSE